MAEPEPTTCPSFMLTLRSPSRDSLEMFIKIPDGRPFTIPIGLSLAKYLAAEAAAFVARVDND